MKIIYQKKLFIFFIFFGSLCTPFLSFINLNFQEINITYTYEIFKYFILHILFIFLLSAFFKIILKNINYLNLLNIFSGIIFINFHYLFIWNLFPVNTVLVLSIIVCLSIIYIFSFVYKITLVSNFFVFYIIITFSFQFILLGNSLFNYKNFELKKSNFYIEKPKFEYNKNIYYIILDSAEKLENLKNKNFVKLRKNFEKLNFKYIEDFRSNYDATHLTVSSLLNLDYIIKESQIYTNRNFLFPNLLFTTKNNGDNIKLINLLNNVGLKFKWIGNQWADCNDSSSSTKFCINNINKRIFEKLFNTYVFEAFYKSSTVFGFSKKLDLIKLSRNILPTTNEANNSILNKCYDDNAICKIENEISNLLSTNDNYFFLIHHLSPHTPYMYDPNNCNAILNPNVEGNYEEEYYCTLLHTLKFIKLINEIDPEGIVIIQSDTGNKSFNGINIVKIDNICSSKEYYNSNIETIRNLIRCIYKKDLINENFYSFFGKNDGKKNFYVKKINE